MQLVVWRPRNIRRRIKVFKLAKKRDKASKAQITNRKYEHA
jgi:hypothetical protein